MDRYKSGTFPLGPPVYAIGLAFQSRARARKITKFLSVGSSVT